ncbi:Shedu immune nuclease family protein [Arthrobacter sp. K5]|uniref:Shedu immune nuclease family protein n=1 Tax=Arthrobacter sp. K5 TaxID=2839623 RepID=A0AAU8ETU0_9MICC
MITFEDHGSKVVLVYTPSSFRPVTWVDNKLGSEGHATLSQVFTVQKTDLLSQDADDEDDEDDGDNEDVRRFVIGSLDGQYRTIRSDVLGLKHDLLIVTTMQLTRSMFVAERNISIFGRIDELLTEQIVVGGDREGAIPVDEFVRLLRRFPTSTEVNYYAATRVTRILREYLETMSDAELRLENYIERRERAETKKGVETHGRIPAANELELEKFTYVRDRLVEMLGDAEGYSEAEWQRAVADLFLLVFPQYIDLMLVGANGCVDIIELKKPFERGLMSKSQYRDNHVPRRELSGSIMQAEKYLFYLSKSGRDGEKAISNKHAASLPVGLEIKIANPKAIILVGRDSNLSAEERFDFEFVRRKYSNVVDIISYDDLLRRLENVIAILTKRVVTEDNLGPDDEIGVSA